MYVAVKGGEKAIEQAHLMLGAYRRGDHNVAELTLAQIEQQLPMGVARVMTEGSLYDPQLAALAIKQSAGDLVEAIFLLRAYRTTLSRFGDSLPLETAQMSLIRRVSAVYKDVPGGQLLGPTFDYTHRLLDFALAAEGSVAELEATSSHDDGIEPCPHVLDLLVREGLVMAPDAARLAPAGPANDVTREPMQYPSNRAQRLQLLARGDEGFLLSLAYSTQRGYGRTHPFLGEIRVGDMMVWLAPEELDFEVPIGTIEITECEMVNQFVETDDGDAQFTRGYGLGFGYCERKTMAMALVDRALCVDDWGDEVTSPAQDEEFVLSHCDNVEASGFVSHLKLPHYVDFQSELELLRKIRAQRHSAAAKPAATKVEEEAK
ncbi:MAG: carbon-phosphorus lyase complex subunit PhnI [Neisseriaceae bacterium]|nr:carbon-phosphorus lyase complex subunit PhnI [Neisseriaceae bacterium]MBP6861929.1 carbon-phosphorus lyase complex subunit PhnI [Neisseriaceae bacterium]